MQRKIYEAYNNHIFVETKFMFEWGEQGEIIWGTGIDIYRLYRKQITNKRTYCRAQRTLLNTL